MPVFTFLSILKRYGKYRLFLFLHLTDLHGQKALDVSINMNKKILEIPKNIWLPLMITNWINKSICRNLVYCEWHYRTYICSSKKGWIKYDENCKNKKICFLGRCTRASWVVCSVHRNHCIIIYMRSAWNWRCRENLFIIDYFFFF